MSLIGPRYDPDKSCLAYCGDEFCNCSAGPLGTMYNYKLGPYMGKKMTALDTQIGGNHFLQFEIKPIQFAMNNHWDACAYGVLANVLVFDMRPDTSELEALNKARHWLALRRETISKDSIDWPWTNTYSMSAFLDVNKIEHVEKRWALMALWHVVTTAFLNDEYYDKCDAAIVALISKQAN